MSISFLDRPALYDAKAHLGTRERSGQWEAFMFQFSVPCLMGVEGLVADELRFQGFRDVTAETEPSGAASFSAATKTSEAWASVAKKCFVSSKTPRTSASWETT